MGCRIMEYKLLCELCELSSLCSMSVSAVEDMHPKPAPSFDPGCGKRQVEMLFKLWDPEDWPQLVYVSLVCNTHPVRVYHVLSVRLLAIMVSIRRSFPTAPGHGASSCGWRRRTSIPFDHAQGL